jgi:hypothetical protein
MVLCLHFNKSEKGTIYVCVFSVDKNELKPESKGIVRATVVMGGWVLEPLPDNPSKTQTTYFSEVDLKGSIPGFVVKTANKDQGS